MTSQPPRVRAIDPPHVVPGGRIAILGDGFDSEHAHTQHVFFGDRRASVTRVSPGTIAAIVPDEALPEVRVERNGTASNPHPVSVAQTLANELDPVANPVFDREGRLYVTFSGSRGEKVPVSVYRIDTDGDIEPFASDIVNPTGLAWGPDDRLYVSSREDGTVYRVDSNGDSEIVADELGVATGLAFDRDGILHVGDRRGTIYRIEPNGEPRSFARLEPSVAAFHLAFDQEGYLYITAPSLASVDPVYRIGPDGHVTVFCGGFGRPQGMAFDTEENLYVTEGLVGDSGVYRIDRDRSVERIAAASPLVGLAFDGDGGLALAATSSIYLLDTGIAGLLPRGS